MIENCEKMEKWEDKKNLISLLFIWLEVEKLKDGKKMSLYKFAHTPLLKNNGQLRPKKKKNNHPIY